MRSRLAQNLGECALPTLCQLLTCCATGWGSIYATDRPRHPNHVSGEEQELSRHLCRLLSPVQHGETLPRGSRRMDLWGHFSLETCSPVQDFPFLSIKVVSIRKLSRGNSPASPFP